MTALLVKMRLLWKILVHEDGPWSVKLLLLAGFFYIIFPLDLIPDYLLLAGWLDDLALAIFVYLMALKWTPEELIKRLLSDMRRPGGPDQGEK